MSRDHHIPAIERAIRILALLGRYADGLPLAEIARETALTRSTVYRILNSLLAAGLVRRTGRQGWLALGPRLIGLAAAVQAGSGAEDLLAVAQPHLARLSALTGEASKLSILDEGRALCIHAVPGSNAYALSPIVGESFPLHAGAASKILLAAMAPEARSALMATPLERFTDETVVDAAALARELLRATAEGWAEDRGEHGVSVSALAAAVRDGAGRVRASVSMAYLRERHQAMRDGHLPALIDCCAAISADLARLEDPRAA